MRRDRRRVVLAVLGVLVLLAMVSPFVVPLLANGAAPTAVAPVASSSTASSPDDDARLSPTASPSTARSVTDDEGLAPVVVLGTGGMTWEVLEDERTPALSALARDSLAANLVVRSVDPLTCRSDGWLGLSSGNRAGGERAEDADGDSGCVDLPPLGASDADGEVPRRAHDYAADAELESFGAVPGTLGDALAEAGVESVGFGAGAALALAHSDGSVGDARPAPADDAELADSVREAVDSGAGLVVVDLDDVGDPADNWAGPDGAGSDANAAADTDADSDSIVSLAGVQDADAETLDARVGAIVAALDDANSDATVVFASLYDTADRSQLQSLVISPADPGAGLISSPSTRADGLVQVPDLLPTILTLTGADNPSGLPGATLLWRSPDPGDAEPAAADARIADLADFAMRARVVAPLISPAVLILVGANIALGAAALVGLNRRVLDRLGGGEPDRTARVRRGVLRGLRAAAIVVGAIPAALIAANLVPWWQAGSPGLGLAAATVGATLVLAAIAVLAARRFAAPAPVVVLSVATIAIITVDVFSGSHLFLGSVLGTQPQLGARYYGMSNHYFALFSTAGILVAAAAAGPLVRAGRRWLAAGVCLAIGLFVAVVDGLPSIGADFGGPPAILPAFAVLALLAAGVRLTWRRVLVIGAVTIAAAVAVLAADWLRPPDDRTHLGRFFQSMLDGGAFEIIGRKLMRNLAILVSSPFTLLAAVGALVAVILIIRPLLRPGGQETSHYGWIVRPTATDTLSATGSVPATGPDGAGDVVGGDSLTTASRLLKPTLISLVILWVIGFAINDSGITIPALGIALALPAACVVLTTWLMSREGAATRGAPGSTASR